MLSFHNFLDYSNIFLQFIAIFFFLFSCVKFVDFEIQNSAKLHKKLIEKKIMFFFERFIGMISF